MGYRNGILKTPSKCKVQIKVDGKMIYRTFTAEEYGSIECAVQEAERFVTTRKRMSTRQTQTGVRNIHEKVTAVNGVEYLYLRLQKGDLDKCICVGRLTTRDKLRKSRKYAVVLSRLSSMLVEKT